MSFALFTKKYDLLILSITAKKQLRGRISWAVREMITHLTYLQSVLQLHSAIGTSAEWVDGDMNNAHRLLLVLPDYAHILLLERMTLLFKGTWPENTRVL